MTYPSNDYTIEQHNAIHYPSSSDGCIGSFWEEKKRMRLEQDKWWNSLTEEEKQGVIARTNEYELSHYLYND